MPSAFWIYLAPCSNGCFEIRVYARCASPFFETQHKVQVLAEDLAKPLREKMGSSQYTDVLLAACFQETVDATKVRGVFGSIARMLSLSRLFHPRRQDKFCCCYATATLG